jgi:histidinol-phosphate aminotransferase|tara:strand:- start:3447 stop:4547 length:1101 start_codon:yes stop_codon:yes gene_type:complete
VSCDFIALSAPGVRDLQPYQPGKPVEELQRELGLSDVVKLASNENPLGPSDKVRESLQAVLPELSRYPDGSAYLLKKALGEHLGVAEDRITIGNGSNDLLELVARVFLLPGDEAIVSQHAFVVYPLVVKAVGAELITVPAKNWAHDLAAMAAAVTDKTRMLFIANPNNPTGTWTPETDLIELLQQVPESVLVILDEAYFEYVQDAAYPNGLALAEQFPNLVITRTFSKVYGLASLRVGYSVSHADIADLMNRIRQPFNVNAMSLAAAEAALADQEYVKRCVAENASGMQQLVDGLEQLGVGYIPSVGNFVTLDVGGDAMPTYQALLREGVIVRPIGVYEMPNHLRVTVGLEAENRRFLDALQKVMQ